MIHPNGTDLIVDSAKIGFMTKSIDQSKQYRTIPDRGLGEDRICQLGFGEMKGTEKLAEIVEKVTATAQHAPVSI